MERASMELPKYKCHKVVHAAQITDMIGNGLQSRLVFGQVGGSIEVSSEWISKHAPSLGGYYVVYEDGYASYSPAQAFESGYAKFV